MLTFHWSELLVVIIGGLVLFFGLALLVLRRRNEMLEYFLTPEEPDLEEDFFRVRKSPSPETSPEEIAETDVIEPTDDSGEETVRWGGMTN